MQLLRQGKKSDVYSDLMPQETLMRDFKGRTIMSVSSPYCASPPSLYIDSQACLQLVLCSCNVQYDVLQYQFKVNRMQIICPSWQKENKHSLGSICTPERKCVRLLPLPKELFWVPFLDDTHLKWSYRTMKYWPIQRPGPPYILITFINSQQSSSSMLDASCPAKLSYCLPLLFYWRDKLISDTL